MGFTWFFIGMVVGVAALIAVALIADGVQEKKRRKAQGRAVANERLNVVHDRVSRSNDRITILERDSVILNKRADCALAYVDGSLAAHEQAFHVSTQGDKKGVKK